MSGRGRFLAIVLALASLAVTAQAQSTTTTITRVYTYNADGAPTSVTTQVDDNQPTVSYLTWDNFVPDANDPSTGTVTPGNGDLLGSGPAPGTDALTKRFTFDAEDRLVGYSDGASAVTYTYHPTWLMASATKASGDSVHFYYDNGQSPRIIHIEHTSTGVLSRRLGPVCSLTDGRQKVLMSPRSDVAGVYDPSQQTFAPYSYDAYGEPSPFDPSANQSPSADYDLGDNPFRYGGEYRDPDWGGYYLRARWYDPSFRTFISRDPNQNLNRFGYTDGNPIARLDPSGQSWKKAISRPTEKFLAPLTKDAAGRILLGPLIAPILLVADPVGFWNGLGPNNTIRALALTGIVGSQLLTGYLPDSNYIAFFALNVAANSGVGVASSYVAASSHGFHRLNRRLFYQGLEYTVGGVLEAHFIFGAGYRPFNLELDDVIKKWTTEETSLENNKETLVFRYKQNGVGSGVSGKGFSFLRGTNPLADYFGTGWYHEGMLALGRDGQAWLTEVTDQGLRVQVWERGEKETNQAYLNALLRKSTTDFKYAGKFGEANVNDIFQCNPKGLVPAPNGGIDVPGGDRERLLMSGTGQYSLFGRNCQLHAGAILRMLGPAN
jgi:RHS repeat-associated protein